MARYKISNKNIYGLNSGMFLTMGICIPVVMALALIVEFFIAPLFYDGYVKRNTVPEGAAGSASAEWTPVAASIADMERLTDGFTFLTNGTVLNHDTTRVGDTIYHRITLDSGEKVFAHINKKALTDTESVGIYRLPVGVWREEMAVCTGVFGLPGSAASPKRLGMLVCCHLCDLVPLL